MNSVQQSRSYIHSHVITNFVQTFETETGLTMASCRDIIEDSNDIFHGFSYLIKHLLSLIDSAIPCKSFTIKYLTALERKDFFVELSKIGIHFTKNSYFGDHHNLCIDICIYTTDIWSIPDYRNTPELTIYQHNIDVFNAFYSHISRFELYSGINSNGYIIVSMVIYLKFKTIFADALTSYNNIINNIQYIHNQPSSSVNTLTNATTLSLSSNSKIKHKLADLIFDIKNNLTDATYKEIIEKIALISP